MPENYFSGRAAERYDELHASMFESEAVDPAVVFLADLAGQGSALELGIGTGRIALPLAQRGVQVHGIEMEAREQSRSRRILPAGRNLITVLHKCHAWRDAA